MTLKKNTDIPVGMEVKTALTELVDDFSTVKAHMKSQILEQEKRLKMIEQNTPNRPTLSAKTDTQSIEKKAFNAYLRNGDESYMRDRHLEEKASSTDRLHVADNTSGGYLVATETSDKINSILRSTASIRSVANVIQIESATYEVLVDRNDLGSSWINDSENAVMRTDTPNTDIIKIHLSEMAALPKVSQRLLDDGAFDIESWLVERISNKFARIEGASLINGTGSSQPTGILRYTLTAYVPNTQNWQKLSYIATGHASDFKNDNPTDSLIDLVYSLSAPYRANATFVMNSKTAGAVRKMKDADGRFLWGDSMVTGEPARLLGYPVLIAEDMHDVGANQYPIAFGDFNAGYTIVERPDMRIQRDPFTQKPHVLFFATKRVGGGVVDFDAIRLLKVAAT